jgi:hypothetical protein
MNDEQTMQGGCLCGAVRYRVTAAPFAAEYCHCRMCQRFTGAAAANWMDFKREAVEFTTGEPREYASSEFVRRGFCARCGSALTFRDTRYPQYFTLTIASLDAPERVRPTRHLFTERQLEWFDVNDDCTRFPRGPGEGMGSE